MHHPLDKSAQKQPKINEIGLEVAEKYGVKWLPSDFKKKEGYKRSIELSREYNLYRQNFCGCVFSKRRTIMNKPLADRIRPTDLSDVVGQRHLLSPDKALYNMIQNGDIPNLIFYGPSGVGKPQSPPS